jgi:pimeloyl-ACP methyl ester carboxylesterase
MMERRRLQARGLVFDVLAAGDPAGEPVLLLHGFPQTAACWTELAEVLAGAGYRLLAPDQRGYSPGAVHDYRMPELVADVLALADRAGVGRFQLVGHDWGGAVAWHLAARHPERVATLTAVSTPHPRAFAAALRFSAALGLHCLLPHSPPARAGPGGARADRAAASARPRRARPRMD